MKLIIALVCLLLCAQGKSQVYLEDALPAPPANTVLLTQKLPDVQVTGKIKINRNQRWKMTRNKYWTGGLVFLAGAAKGFNEALQYQYNGFESFFPKANDQWFYPAFSFKNKYKNGDPRQGPKFPLSTSLLVMCTDQYHLNNFIQRSALTAALVIKIGEGKKPFRHYVYDLVYYTACYQVGFHSIYTPIQVRNGK